MLCHLPSLQTVACGFSEAFSALTASPALVVSYLQYTESDLMAIASIFLLRVHCLSQCKSGDMLKHMQLPW